MAEMFDNTIKKDRVLLAAVERGADIDAACGQLRGKVESDTEKAVL